MLAWNLKESWTGIRRFWNLARGRVRGDWYQYVLLEEDRILRKCNKCWAKILIGGHLMIATGFILPGYPFLIVVYTFGTFYCRRLGFLFGFVQHFGLNSDESDFR